MLKANAGLPTATDSAPPQRRIALHFTEHGPTSVPAVTWAGRTFTDSVDAMLALRRANHPLEEKLRLAAQIINHLAFAGQYHLIEDPNDFKNQYRATYNGGRLRLALANHHNGAYDVSEIDLPHLRNGRLVFWVYARHTLVPYRVSIPYPLTSLLNELTYELLPHLVSPAC